MFIHYIESNIKYNKNPISTPPPQFSLSNHVKLLGILIANLLKEQFFKILSPLQNTAGQNQPKLQNMISHENWKRNWGKNQEEKMIFFSQNFWISRREIDSVCKISFIREEKEKLSSNLIHSRREIFFKITNFARKFFYLQNLDNQEHREMKI